MSRNPYLIRLAAATLALAMLSPAIASAEMVFGYYPGYRFAQMPPDKIDWSGVNCINHFAADPNPDGTLDLARFALFPERIDQMVQLARDNDACVLLTVGGGNTKFAFAEATATPTVRAKFIDNIVNTILQYGYDGVDIDWEPLQDSDETSFVALIRELRGRLDVVMPEALLTIATGYQWGTNELKNTTAIVARVASELDYIHLMTYGLAGPWGGWVTWHNSALSNGGATFPNSTKPLPTAQVVVQQFVAVGIPQSQLVLGLAFFGKIWQGGAGTPTGGVTAPRQSWTTAPTMSGEQQYHTLVARSDFASTLRWDDAAQNPYLSRDQSGSSTDQFVPFEDPRSIPEKVKFAAQQGLAGMMIWELRGDYLPDGSHPLVAALKTEYQAQYGMLPGDVIFVPPGGGEPPPPPPPPTAMHVGDLDGAVTMVSKKNWTAVAAVRVHKVDEASVSWATVNGRWQNGVATTCVTDSAGVCTFPNQRFSSKVQSATLSITGITHGSDTYDPSGNHDPDGDSNGTSIVVAR